MKKIFKLSALLLVAGLVSCSGRSITKEETIALLENIQEKQETEEPVDPNVFRMQQVMSVSDFSRTQKIEVITALDVNAKQIYIKASQSLTTAGDVSSSYSVSDYSLTEETWAFIKDDILYAAHNATGNEVESDNAKEYFHIDDKEAAQLAFDQNATQAIGILNSSVFRNIDTSTFINLLSGEVSGYRYDYTSEKYSSWGNGNLSVDLAGDAYLGETKQNSFKFAFAYDDYKLTYIYSSSETSNQINITEARINYKGSGIILPNLANYTDITNEIF